jgi:ankyrin repeat protein
MHFSEITKLLLKFNAEHIQTLLINHKPLDKKDISTTPSKKYPIFDSGDANIDCSNREAFKNIMDSHIYNVPATAYIGSPQLLKTPDCQTFTDVNNCTVLMKLSLKGHYQLIKDLLKSNIVDLDAVDFEGNTALVWSILGGNSKIAKLLLDSGCNVNGLPNPSTKTITNSPLSICAFTNNVEIAKLLYETKKLDFNQLLINGRTSLKIAVLMRNLEIIKFIIQSGSAIIDPLFQVWMENGIVSFKKLAIKSNPFYNLQIEGKSLKNDASSTHKTRPSRTNLQEKLIYCSGDDLTIMNEMSKILKMSLNTPQNLPVTVTLTEPIEDKEEELDLNVFFVKLI